MAQNSEDIVMRRRASVARLYLEGWRQVDIAIREGVTQGQISQDLDAIRADWLSSTITDFNQAKAQELAKIDQLEATLWQAWYDSKQPLKKKSTRMKGEVDAPSPTGPPAKPRAKNMETMEHTEERLGDPRYLLGIDRCIERRCRILGLEAPFKIAPTDAAGKDLKAASTVLIVDMSGGARSPAPDEEYEYTTKN